MPTMQDIYLRHANEYDELVTHEDHEGNLPRILHTLADFRGSRVLEFGCGTGRLTRMYAGLAREVVCCDRSDHMLARARANLAGFGDRITFRTNDHVTPLPDGGGFDVVLEGWSFGHVITEHPADVEPATAGLLESCRRHATPACTLIVIETLGTDVERPEPPKECLGAFYRLIEESYGFERHVVKTDYRFDSVVEAARVMGFFFGEFMRDRVLRRGSPVVPEFTGLWILNGD